MAQKKKSENSVKLTEKKSYTREEKNSKVNSSVKKEIKEENSNKKIIIIALILALLIAGVSYWRVSVNKAEKENNKDNEQKEEVKDTEQEVEEEEDNDSESYYYDYTYEVTPVVKEEKDDEVLPEVEEVYYSLTFESNGGSDIETQILGVNEVTESKLPTREGWIFAGWFTDSELTEEYIFNTHLTEDITIYAKWVKHVKYIYEGTELEDINVVGLNEEIPLLSKDDERFAIDETQELGWLISMVDEDENIVTFEVLPGTTLDEELASNFDEEIVLESKVLAKFNMNFNYTVETVSEDSEVGPTEEDNVISLEVIEGRTIDFDKVENEISETYPEFVDKDFGWYYYDGNVTFDLPNDAVANTEITEVYMGEVVTITYIEKVYDEELEVEVDKEITTENIVKDSHIDEDNILVPDEKEGQEFVGWFPVIDDEGTIGEDKLTSDIIIDEDKTFVGKWEEIIDETVEEDEVLTVPEESETSEEDVVEESLEEEPTTVDLEIIQPIDENQTEGEEA